MKVWLIIASVLVIIGILMLGSVMISLDWNFANLSTKQYETATYEIQQEFNNIFVDSDTADIGFALSSDGKCKVVCYEEENSKHSVSVSDGTLIIKLEDNRKWYEHIGINFQSEKITVYLPENEYGNLSVTSSTSELEISNDFCFENIDISLSTGNVINYASASEEIKIKTGTGSIKTENIDAKTIELSVSTGGIIIENAECGDIKVNVSTGKSDIKNVKCDNFSSEGSTGDIILNNVVIEKNLSVERSTGDVKFVKCDADEITIKTDTGDVTGSLLSDKIFVTNTDTGDVNVPETTQGGKCKIITSTGDIKIEIDS